MISFCLLTNGEVKRGKSCLLSFSNSNALINHKPCIFVPCLISSSLENVQTNHFHISFCVKTWLRLKYWLINDPNDSASRNRKLYLIHVVSIDFLSSLLSFLNGNLLSMQTVKHSIDVLKL